MLDLKPGDKVTVKPFTKAIDWHGIPMSEVMKYAGRDCTVHQNYGGYIYIEEDSWRWCWNKGTFVVDKRTIREF